MQGYTGPFEGIGKTAKITQGCDNTYSTHACVYIYIYTHMYINVKETCDYN